MFSTICKKFADLQKTKAKISDCQISRPVVFGINSRVILSYCFKQYTTLDNLDMSSYLPALNQTSSKETEIAILINGRHFKLVDGKI